MRGKFFPKAIIAGLLFALVTLNIFLGELQMIVSASSWEVHSDSWVVTDSLGRTTGDSSVVAPKKDKFVGIHYSIGHGEGMIPTINTDMKAPRNISQIIKEKKNALEKVIFWGPDLSYHYWGEPLYGYYDLSVDDYVIRKHAQMLTDVGVDTLIIDYTGYAASGNVTEVEYCRKTLTHFLDTFNEIRSEGGDTPQITFLLTWNGEYNGLVAKKFYDDYYSKEEYKALWFHWEGKPLILAHDTNVPNEIKAFFTYRKPHAFYTPVTEANTWPWLSIYPQEPAYTENNDCECVAVSVAQNWTDSLDFFSAQDENGNFIARGRSYTVGGNNVLTNNPISDEYKSQYGANLQQQFDRAIELDPDMIFISDWNEWIAARFLTVPSWAAMSKNEATPPFGAFCDQFTTEFSRDAEPTREGGLGDSFYNQLVINIRRFKGSSVPDPTEQSKQIDLAGSFEQWNEISYEYRDDINDISVRNATSIGQRVTYTNDTGRNDFRMSKVTYDNDNIYFYIETVADITPYTDSDWMNLLLQVSCNNPNWEGFDYIVNRTNVREGVTTLEKSAGGNNWEVVSDDIKYTVNGNKMMISIPKCRLGYSEEDEISLNFKWADNAKIAEEGDALAFYLNGDCAPNERFCYHFAEGNQENAKNINLSQSSNKLLVLGIIGAALILCIEIVLILKSVKIKLKKF